LKNNLIQEIIDLHYNSHMFIMICFNLIFQIGLSQYTIVYQIMLLLLLPEIHLKQVLINSGRTKTFDTIGKLTYLLPEVAVKLS